MIETNSVTIWYTSQGVYSRKIGAPGKFIERVTRYIIDYATKQEEIKTIKKI